MITRRQRRRLLVVALLRAAVVVAACVVAYFVLPLTATDDGHGLPVFLGGMLILTGLFVWQVRAIADSPYPRLRAMEAWATTLPLFLLLFAAIYYVMDVNLGGSFSEDLSRLDALYFTVTVFVTVGFGDITAVSETARVATTIQMLVDLVLVGLLARVVVQAVQTGIGRQSGEPGDTSTP